MANKSLDLEDHLPLVAYYFAVASLTGVSSMLVFTNTLSLDAVHSIAGFEISMAFIVAVVGLGIVAITNEMDPEFLKAWDDEITGERGRKYDQMSRYLALGAVVLLVGVEFIGGVSDFVASGEMIRTLTFIVMAAGGAAISWAA
jgi:hypothetical protein